MASVNVISCLPGTGWNALGKAVNAAAGATDTGLACLAVRDDVLAPLAPADGSYAPLRVNSDGALWVKHPPAATLGSEGNLFAAVTVVAPDTYSSTVDVTAVSHVNILVSGSDTTATAAYDVYLSANGGTTLYRAHAIYPSSTDSAGGALASRFGALTVNVAGVNALRLVAHSTETVTATCVGQ